MHSEIAILMAAGLGSRMRPITDNIPKPLVKVKGVSMIETVIGGLRERGVRNIVVVTGYLGNQFQYLMEKYDGLKLMENKDYRCINNISSIKTVSKMLQSTDSDVFICEADLYVTDKSVFLRDLPQSGYFGKMVKGYSDDWVFEQDSNGNITRIGKKGNDCYNMVGICFLKNRDARILGHLIDEAYNQDGFENLFWDEVVNQNLDKLKLAVYEVNPSSIIEIDTVEELAAVDESYAEVK